MFVEVKKLHPVGDQDIRLNAMAIAYTYPIPDNGGTVIRMTGGETFSIAGSQDDLEEAIYDALAGGPRRRSRPQDLDLTIFEGAGARDDDPAEAAAPSPSTVAVEAETASGARAQLGDDPTASRRRSRAASPAAPGLDLQPAPAAPAETPAEGSAEEELPPATPEAADPLAPA